MIPNTILFVLASFALALSFGLWLSEVVVGPRLERARRARRVGEVARVLWVNGHQPELAEGCLIESSLDELEQDAPVVTPHKKPIARLPWSSGGR